MPRFVLECRADEMEEVARVALEAHVERHYLELECSCGARSPEPLYLEPGVLVEVPGSRGEAHLVVKCKGCERVNNVKLAPLAKGEAGFLEAPGRQWAPLLALECRGVAPVSYLLASEEQGGSFHVTTASGTDFHNVSLLEDWAEYEETTQSSPGIYGFEVRWERA